MIDVAWASCDRLQFFFFKSLLNQVKVFWRENQCMSSLSEVFSCRFPPKPNLSTLFRGVITWMSITKSVQLISSNAYTYANSSWRSFSAPWCPSMVYGGVVGPRYSLPSHVVAEHQLPLSLLIPPDIVNYWWSLTDVGLWTGLTGHHVARNLQSSHRL